MLLLVSYEKKFSIQQTVCNSCNGVSKLSVDVTNITTLITNGADSFCIIFVKPIKHFDLSERENKQKLKI